MYYNIQYLASSSLGLSLSAGEPGSLHRVLGQEIYTLSMACCNHGNLRDQRRQMAHSGSAKSTSEV